MDSEKMWKSIAKRKDLEIKLFERKFINYRNKILEILDRLEDRNELPDLQNEIRKFMQNKKSGEDDGENRTLEDWLS